MSNASDLANNSVGLDAIEENKVPALGDGSLLPCSACTIITATGKIDGADAGAVDEFIGLLEKRYDKTIDTAPADGESCELILPQQSHKYVVRIDSDNTAAGNAGKPLELSATSLGEFMDAANLGDKVMCRLAEDYDGSDDFAKVFWGAA